MDAIIGKQKGFEFWSQKDRRDFVRIYWLTYVAVYFGGAWLTMVDHNLAAYILIGLVPRVVANIYRYIRKPEHGLAENVRDIDPAFYGFILDEMSKVKQARNFVQNSGSWISLFYAKVFTSNKTDIDHRILVYRNNVRRFDLNVSTASIIWVLTCAIFPFIAWAFHLQSD